MPEQLTVLTYAYPDEKASLAAFQAVMANIAGGSAYRVLVGGSAPVLVVFALHNVVRIQAACVRAGGVPTVVSPDLIRDLAERSAHAAQHNITGRRHHEPGTKAADNLPTNPDDYTPTKE